MTWIKPSFLWLMARSGWGTKPNQERTLAVRMTRAGWEEALHRATLTAFHPGAHPSRQAWGEAFDRSPVHVQWDPERSLRGGKLAHRSIQVGIGRALVGVYADEWVVGLADLSPLTTKLRALRKAGRWAQARRLLPPERLYPVAPEIARRLAMSGAGS